MNEALIRYKIRRQLLPTGARIIKVTNVGFRKNITKNKRNESERVEVMYAYDGELRRSNFSASSCGLQRKKKCLTT